MPLRSKQSLLRRVGVTIITVVTLIMLFFSILVIAVFNDRTNEEIKRRMDNVINVSWFSLSMALWNNDGNMTKSIVQSLRTDPNVVFIEIRDSIENTILQNPDDKDFPFFQEHPNQYLTEEYTIQYTNAFKNKTQSIGKIRVAISKESFKQDLRIAIVFILLLTIAVILAISSLLIFLMKRYVFEPLNSLEKSASAIAAHELDTEIDTGLDDEIGKLAQALNQMRLAIKKDRAEILKAKEEAEIVAKEESLFLAHASHEIRTPMNSIVGYTREILETELTSEQVDYLSHIDASSKDLLKIVDDILDFSKIKSGKLKVANNEFQLDEVVRSVLKHFQGVASQKGLELRLEKDAGFPEYTILGDSGRLKQVLNNLVGNAVKFTNEGRVVLRVACVSEDETKVCVRFEVKDTGCGLSSDDLERVFLPYEQVERDSRRGAKGFGLGLPISKRIVELMRGKLEVNSEPGKGSNFYFSIPFARHVIDSQKSEVKNDIKQFNSQALNGLRVLVAEDDESSQDLIKGLLEKKGLIVDVVENGKAVLTSIAEKRYDVILMDMQMPVMDGYEAIRQIRKMEDRKTVPIIAQTAHAMVGDDIECLNAGADDYLSKPIDKDILFSKILKWVLKSDEEIEVLWENNIGIEGHSQSNITIENVPGIDIKWAMDRWNTDMDTIRKNLKLFAGKHADDLKKIKVAIDNNSINEACNILHGLKGASLNAGAKDLGNAALELESYLKNKGKEQLPESLINVLETLFQTVFDSIQKLESEIIEVPMEVHSLKEVPINKEEIRTFLINLAQNLEQNRFNATNLVVEADRLLVFTETLDDVKKMKEEISKFDFEDALETLAIIANKIGIPIQEE